MKDIVKQLVGKYNQSYETSYNKKENILTLSLRDGRDIKFLIEPTRLGSLRTEIIYYGKKFKYDVCSVTKTERLLDATLANKLDFEYVECEKQHYKDKLLVKGWSYMNLKTSRIVVTIISLVILGICLYNCCMGIQYISRRLSRYTEYPIRFWDDIIPFPMFIVGVVLALICLVDVIRSKYMSFWCKFCDFSGAIFTIIGSEMLVLGIRDYKAGKPDVAATVALVGITLIPGIGIWLLKILGQKGVDARNVVECIRIPIDCSMDTYKYVLDYISDKVHDRHKIMIVDTKANDKLKATDTKLFGIPYCLAGELSSLENKFGKCRSAVMIAQINLSDIGVGTGLLQIFNILNINNTESFQVLYHKDFDESLAEDLVTAPRGRVDMDIANQFAKGFKISIQEEADIYKVSQSEINELMLEAFRKLGKSFDEALTYNHMHSAYVQNSDLTFAGEIVENPAHNPYSDDITLFTIDTEHLYDALLDDRYYGTYVKVIISRADLANGDFDKCRISRMTLNDWR